MTVQYNSLPPSARVYLVQVDTSLGNCWPMVGTSGRLTVVLATPAVVTAVSIDHASPSVAVAELSTAPHSFTVYGLSTAPPNSEAAFSTLEQTRPCSLLS